MISLLIARWAESAWGRDGRATRRGHRALREVERERDDLAAANAELQRANVAIRAMHLAFAELLNLADERSHGQMRELIEDTGTELAQLLEEQLARAQETPASRP